MPVIFRPRQFYFRLIIHKSISPIESTFEQHNHTPFPMLTIKRVIRLKRATELCGVFGVSGDKRSGNFRKKQIYKDNTHTN